MINDIEKGEIINKIKCNENEINKPIKLSPRYSVLNLKNRNKNKECIIMQPLNDITSILYIEYYNELYVGDSNGFIYLWSNY